MNDDEQDTCKIAFLRCCVVSSVFVVALVILVVSMLIASVLGLTGHIGFSIPW